MDISIFNSELLLFAGLTLGMVGKVLLGYTVLSVHWKIVKEHRVDQAVLREIRKERNVAIIAILFIVIGYLFELTFFEFIPFSECGFVSKGECAELQMLAP